MTTKILGNQITSYTIDTVQLSNTATAAFAKTLAPKVLYANVANSLYYTVDDTAVNVGGGYIVVTGAEFQSGATVLIDTTPASAVTYVNSTTLQVQVPTKSAASYNLYVVNPDGGVGIKVAGITYSSEPSWVTSSPLNSQNSGSAFGVNLSATSATSYSLAAGSTLPAGTTLAANGYFSGTITVGSQTTYTFSVVATDAENQDSSKTFQVTVTVVPSGQLFSAGFGPISALNDSVYRSSPVQVGTNSNWVSIIGTTSTVHGIKSDGTLWAWYSNEGGQLGLNDVVNRSSPVQVGTDTNWSVVGGTSGATAAVKTNNTLWTWGYNNYGQLGLNDVVNRSSPVQVGTGTDWATIINGKGFSNSTNLTLATKTNGTLWVWGYNNNGQLGVDNRTDRSSPVQVGTETNWPQTQNKLTATSVSVLTIKTDGTLWLWGSLNYLVGPGGAYRSSPTQIGTNTNWSLISGGWYHVAAIKTDGTLWSWGRNNEGALGINSIVSRSSPVQIGSATNWSQVRCGMQNTVAVKTDGTLWTWGNNFSGSLGMNDRVVRSSPVQVGTNTSWLTTYGSIAIGNGLLAISQ